MSQLKINRIKVLPGELTEWTGYDFKEWIEKLVGEKCTTFDIMVNKFYFERFHDVEAFVSFGSAELNWRAAELVTKEKFRNNNCGVTITGFRTDWEREQDSYRYWEQQQQQHQPPQQQHQPPQQQHQPPQQQHQPIQQQQLQQQQQPQQQHKIQRRRKVSEYFLTRE